MPRDVDRCEGLPGAPRQPHGPSGLRRDEGQDARAVLFKHFGVEAARELVPWHPTLGDVDSPQALEDYQAEKTLHKAEWAKAQPT